MVPAQIGTAKGTSVSECIHGLELALCDLCTPKAIPEPVRRASVARAPRAPSVRTTDSRAPRVTTTKKSIDAAAQRIYHVTHIRNLEAILSAGELRADAVPVLDVSTPLTRELRATASVGAPVVGLSSGADTLSAGESVAEHVAFYLSPEATLWEDLRSGATDDVRWSPAARAALPVDFVILVSTIGGVGPGVVVTDGDAAGSLTRFFGGDRLQQAVERAHDNDEVRGQAEALVPGSVPFDAIQLIGVANDPVRDRVREIVASHGGTGAAPKVAVYPPWFALGPA